MTIRIRGIDFEDNLKNSMGIEFYNLSHRFGYQSPNWPYFEDVKIERIHYMAKSGVLSQRITTSMHSTTHIDAPAHVVQGTPFIDEVPLPHFFGSGLVGAMPKALDRQPNRPAHVRFIVSAPGFKPVATHIFTPDCPWLGDDAVFGVKESLIAEFKKSSDAEFAAARGLPVPFWQVEWDFVLSQA
jgi:hypothetical protein